jgi:hypothetical protein
MKNLNFTFTAVALIGLATGCAHSPPMIEGDNAPNSHILIAYDLGHTHYRFKARALQRRAEISSWRDDQVLEKKVISLDQYRQFADRVYELVRSHPNEEINEDCRTPYKISLEAQKKEVSVSGCRSEKNNETVGQVIKEGEFLFYK